MGSADLLHSADLLSPRHPDAMPTAGARMGPRQTSGLAPITWRAWQRSLSWAFIGLPIQQTDQSLSTRDRVSLANA